MLVPKVPHQEVFAPGGCAHADHWPHKPIRSVTTQYEPLGRTQTAPGQNLRTSP